MGLGCIWRMARRGGNWNNGSNAGVFALNVNNLRSNTNTNIGFRPALLYSQKLVLYGAPASAENKGS
jgi:RNA-directed DNA polymerase